MSEVYQLVKIGQNLLSANQVAAMLKLGQVACAVLGAQYVSRCVVCAAACEQASSSVPVLATLK